MSGFVFNILNVTTPEDAAEEMCKFVFRMLSTNPDNFSAAFLGTDIQQIKHNSGHFFCRILGGGDIQDVKHKSDIL